MCVNVVNSRGKVELVERPAKDDQSGAEANLAVGEGGYVRR